MGGNPELSSSSTININNTIHRREKKERKKSGLNWTSTSISGNYTPLLILTPWMHTMTNMYSLKRGVQTNVPHPLSPNRNNRRRRSIKKAAHQRHHNWSNRSRQYRYTVIVSESKLLSSTLLISIPVFTLPTKKKKKKRKRNKINKNISHQNGNSNYSHQTGNSNLNYIRDQSEIKPIEIPISSCTRLAEKKKQLECEKLAEMISPIASRTRSKYLNPRAPSFYPGGSQELEEEEEEEEDINVQDPEEIKQEEIEEFMECGASVTGCSEELSSDGSSTFWTAKDEDHSQDGGNWSMDSSISSTSLEYNELESKMKGNYELAPGSFEETYGIVKTAPGKFECYIKSTLKGNELREAAPEEYAVYTDPSLEEDSTRHKEDPDDWTWTSSFIDDGLPPSTDLSKDAEERRIQFCELYVQDFFWRTHRFHDKALNERLERRGITLKRNYTKEETRQMKREVKENRRKKG